MNTALLESQVLDLVASTINLDRSLLTAKLTMEELGLDSLDVLKVTFALEQHFRINLAAYNYTDVTSLGRLIEILQTETKRAGEST